MELWQYTFIGVASIILLLNAVVLGMLWRALITKSYLKYIDQPKNPQSKVISRPGAVIRVEEVEIDEATRQRLTAPNVKRIK